ncbi:MAG: hypothetical protein LBR80_14270 [Deltaproteobacteria bacterium]|nr:hypothetical protein [Deltaproteobacteria bacterium]
MQGLGLGTSWLGTASGGKFMKPLDLARDDADRIRFRREPERRSIKAGDGGCPYPSPFRRRR